MGLVVSRDLAVAHREERIGHLGITLYDPLTVARLVGSLHSLCSLQRVDVHTTLHQTGELLQLALQTQLLKQLAVGCTHLRIGLCLGHELINSLHVVQARCRISKGVVERLRELLAAEHRHLLLVGEEETHLLESRIQHLLSDERLPRSVGQHSRLLLVALGHTRLRLYLLIAVVILRIVYVLTIHNTHLGVVTGESHLGLQREDKCQERKGDHDRKHDAELGAKCV